VLGLAHHLLKAVLLGKVTLMCIQFQNACLCVWQIVSPSDVTAMQHITGKLELLLVIVGFEEIKILLQNNHHFVKELFALIMTV
jgi:hypothetical protein